MDWKVVAQNMDGKPVKYAGIITSVKKKYTKNNTIMAFVTVEDLYGSCEITQERKEIQEEEKLEPKGIVKNNK